MAASPLLHSGFGIRELLIGCVHLIGWGLFHLVPALFLGHIEKFGLGLVILI